MSTSSTACSDSVCSICLDTCSVVSYADGCLHKFCGRCIFEWAQRSQLCPICRTFFANIITNVTSDTDYEVIPLEDRRVPVSNFIRNSWWNNNSYPSNRNIFAVRQFNQRSSQHQQYHQPPQLTSSSSNPPSRAISQQHQHQHQHQQQQQQGNEGYQAISRLEEPDIGNLQIDNPRPRRIVWSSNRYSNRQFNRQQPQPTSSHHENVVALRQIISPAFRTDYHNRGHNQPLTSPRHSFNPRPFRPLVGVRQENQQNQNQNHNQPQQNHQHSSQSSNQLNVNYQQPHHSHSHSYPQPHSHPHPHSHSHSHSHPHPHHYHYNSSVHSHNSHQTQPHHSHHHHLHSHPHSGPHPHPQHHHHHHHHQQTACKRLSSRPNERQWRR